nr:LUD domain-containing protein [Candidatus Protofrankia datiscae]
MTAIFLGTPAFPRAARQALADTQLRRNLAHATTTIRDKRARAVGELDDWEALRLAGAAIKERTLRHLDGYLEQFERAVTAAGGQVHWAGDAAEANRIVIDLVRAAGVGSGAGGRATGADEVVKVKSMVTAEIGLNDALAAAGITAVETDLAELIIQLAGDRPSHILAPAIHLNRAEIREIFLREMADAPAGLTDQPWALAAARPARTCGAGSSRRRWGSPGRTSRSPTAAPWWWSSQRATAGCA